MQEIQISISCGNSENISGTFKFAISDYDTKVLKTSVPLSINASNTAIRSALTDLTKPGEVELIRSNNSFNSRHLVVTFLNDIGFAENLSISAQNVRCRIDLGYRTVTVQTMSNGTFFQKYGYDYIYFQESRCGSIAINEKSPTHFCL